MSEPPTCVECGGTSKLVDGAYLYPHRPDLADHSFWKCTTPECPSWCGCHPGTTVAKGRPGGRGTREARQDAHIVFDRIWKKRLKTRQEAYGWLAAQLGIPREACHIGAMSASEARRVVAVCDRFWVEQTKQ